MLKRRNNINCGACVTTAGPRNAQVMHLNGLIKGTGVS
jgi:hypothetical protein